MAEHGDAKLTDLLMTLAACPKARSVSVHDGCEAAAASGPALAGKSRRIAAEGKARRGVWANVRGVNFTAIAHFPSIFMLAAGIIFLLPRVPKLPMSP
jgi:hypothetical protein